MFRLPPIDDPRMALFGLTMLSQKNPAMEQHLEMVAGILEATRNSLSVIRGEMRNFQASMYSLAAGTPPEFSTQPVHATEEQYTTDIPLNYSNPNYSNPNPNYPLPTTQEEFPPVMETMHVKDKLERVIKAIPENMKDFLDDLERLIRKYRK